MNNLRNIGLALRAYHVAHGSFPPAYIADENGEPLLSWRVLLLPYLDSAALYRKFDLTKPWDSPENLKLAKVELPFYSCPSHRSRKRESMTTSYLAVTGPHAAWPGSTTMESSGLKDGEANTILVIEHHSDVVWTEPRDLTLEEAAQALASTDPDNFEGHGRETLFEEIYDQGRNVAFADGRVTLVAPALDRTLATELLTIDDGKPADDWYRQMERSVSIRQAKWRNVILFWTCVGLSVLPLPWVWIHPHGSQTQATVNPSAPDTQLPGERGA